MCDRQSTAQKTEVSTDSTSAWRCRFYSNSNFVHLANRIIMRIQSEFPMKLSIIHKQTPIQAPYDLIIIQIVFVYSLNWDAAK